MFQALEHKISRGVNYFSSGNKQKFVVDYKKFSRSKQCAIVCDNKEKSANFDLWSKVLLFEKTDKNEKIFIFVWFFAHLIVPLHSIW